MTDRAPCHCIPTCTKELSARQRRRHRQLLRAALAHTSDPSDNGSDNESPDLPDINIGTGDQGQELQEVIEYNNNPDPGPGSDPWQPDQYQNYDYMDSDINDSVSSHSSTPSEADIPNNISPEYEADENLESDEISDEHLMEMLQQRFGDEWRHQLHILRK